MAMQSKVSPEWVYAEAIREASTLDIKMRVAIRANDGWVKVLDVNTDGWIQDVPPSRRQILENIKENIALELAKLTLEET